MNKDIHTQAFTFKDRYNYDYSKQYYQRHKQGGFKYISNVLEQFMADKALSLAANPHTVLDLPCGAGRFWETLIRHGVKKIIGMDQSEGMLQVCRETAPAEYLQKVELLQGDATQIPLPDKSVDSVFCMRLLHHIDIKSLRMKFYKEFQRVSAGTVCISYWVDGNLKSEINQRRPHKNQNYLNQALLEDELKEAGFEIIGYVDMLKFYSPWRTYVLRAK
jgi:SAM-dependent methyltransferase